MHRTHLIHEYKITNFSLYAAVSLGIVFDEIVSNLERWSKVALPAALLEFIRKFSTRYGKVKLLLQRTGYVIESAHDDILEGHAPYQNLGLGDRSGTIWGCVT